MSFVFSDAVLMRSLILLLVLGSVAGLFAGAALLLRPDLMVLISKVANRWVSTRQMARPLGQPINIDQWFYRYSYVSGAVLLTGAIYIVYMFTAQVVRTDLLASLGKMHLVQAVLLEPLLDTLVLLVLSGALLALLVSLFLIFRPSMLRDIELGANQLVSLRRALKPVEIQRSELDLLVTRHAWKAGLLLLLGSVYTFVVLAYWLSK